MQEQAMPEKSGSVQDIVIGIHEGMTKLAKLIDSNEVLAPEEKQEFQALMSGYENFVDKLTSMEQPQKPKPMPGTTMPDMAGNKNAQPMMM